MRPVWSVEETRRWEAVAGVGEGVLIQRAAAAVATTVIGLLDGAYGRHVLVVAGTGHNGADALWAGWRLRERGARVDVVLPLGDPADEHGAVPLRRLRAAGARIVCVAGAGALLASTDVVLDGVLGVGARPEPPPWPELRDLVGDALVVAVDLPSGLDADTGAGRAIARADVTVTFGAPKPGLVVGPGRVDAGELVVAPIGLGPAPTPPTIGVGRSPTTTFRRQLFEGGPEASAPPRTALLDADDVAALLAVPDAASSKYTRGVVGVLAGSADYPGAAALACAGALGGGAGFVRLFAPPPVLDLVRSRHPEVVGHPLPASGADLPRVDRWVVGPGLGSGEAACAAVRLVLAVDRPVVLDADAIAIAGAAGIRERAAPTLITPHAGELARLLGTDAATVDADPLGVARSTAADLRCLVLAKGTATVVADPHGVARVNPTGTPWLATAGTGDVLAGLCGALWRGDVDSAAAGPWLHGLAARLAAGEPGAPITAGDVAARLPEAVRLVRAGAG